MSGVVGLILAGGQSRRMGGGDKCLLELVGRPMLQWVIDRAAPQVDALVLNANGPAARFASFGLTVLPDVVPGFVGPLGGILTGLEWAATHHPKCSWLVSFPSDAPLVPKDYVQKLLAVAIKEDAEIVCAVSNNRTHPVCALWSVALASQLRHAVVEQRVRKIDAWTVRHRLTHAAFDDDPFDPFFNVNAPEDLAEADRLLR